MTADINAAKERLTGDFNLSGPDCPPGLYCKINGQWATKVLREDLGALLADHARLEGENERLKSREEHFAKVLGVTDGGQYRHDWDARLTGIVSALADARRQIAEQREALKPFAEKADRYRDSDLATIHDNVQLWQLEGNAGMRVDITVGDIRRAAALLASSEPAGRKEGIMAHMPSPERLREQIAGDPDVDVEAGEPPLRLDMQARRMTRCQADCDGDCEWSGCPQLRDNEPHATGRHCPLDHEQGEG